MAIKTYTVVSIMDVIKNPKINCVLVNGVKVMGKNDFLCIRKSNISLYIIEYMAMEAIVNTIPGKTQIS
jgi:hypothetical protein